MSPESMITVHIALTGPTRSARKPMSVRPIAAEKLSTVTGSADSCLRRQLGSHISSTQLRRRTVSERSGILALANVGRRNMGERYPLPPEKARQRKN